MQSLDVQDPGMPDLQFVLFVAALCTSDLPTINISEDLRRNIFDRCWALVHTSLLQQTLKNGSLIFVQERI